MISAVVLAAGLSKRMGKPKLVLPWGAKTVIEQVVDTLIDGGIEEIVVVTGGSRQQVEDCLHGRKVRFILNPVYENGEMLCSLQAGLSRIDQKSDATLMVLGDQPQIEVETVRAIILFYNRQGAKLMIPSFNMRRGHPWLINRSLWPEILELKPPATLRDFLANFEKEITYLPVDTPSILKDLDTPDEYLHERPGSSLA